MAPRRTGDYGDVRLRLRIGAESQRHLDAEIVFRGEEGQELDVGQRDALSVIRLLWTQFVEDPVHEFHPFPRPEEALFDAALVLLAGPAAVIFHGYSHSLTTPGGRAADRRP